VVRTRLQTQALHAERGSSTVSAAGIVRSIWREEGPAAFYKGLGATMIGLSHIAIQFPLYELVKRQLRAREGGPEEDLGEEVVHRSSVWHVLAASSVSKFVASTLTYPHELIRARLQDQRTGLPGVGAPNGERQYTGMMDVVRRTVSSEGFLGLWQGYSINIVRTVPQCMITFGIYEWMIWKL